MKVLDFEGNMVSYSYIVYGYTTDYSFRVRGFIRLGIYMPWRFLGSLSVLGGYWVFGFGFSVYRGLGNIFQGKNQIADGFPMEKQIFFWCVCVCVCFCVSLFVCLGVSAVVVPDFGPMSQAPDVDLPKCGFAWENTIRSQLRMDFAPQH